MAKSLEKFSKVFAACKNYTVKSASRRQVAINFLRESETKASTVLLMSLRSLYGVDALYWEPETIWLTLTRDHEIDLEIEARDKIQAAISLIRNPIFYSDSLVFQRTVQAFNDELYSPESLQECHPAHMARSIYEAGLLRGLDPEDDALPELDEDVQQYAAVCLMRAGYVYPPDQLREVTDNLEHLLPSDQTKFQAEVKKSWENMDKEALLDRRFKESPLDVQLAQLASCHIYITEQITELANDVMALESM